VTVAGYQILRWYTRKTWETQPDKPEAEFPGRAERQGKFEWLISKPESKLVFPVAFFQQQAHSAATGEGSQRQ
jgi:hypothetical protein